ncbi:MAG: CPBP family intramembrane metalloprotease [Bacilli bacterium]|nr:CPBP family intramembrane metalloprotease [Bacilli bacterium]
MKKDKTQNLLKAVICFFVYFVYSMYSLNIGKSLGIKNDVITMFVSDLLFLIFIVLMYYKNVKNDIKNLKKVKVSKVIKRILFWVALIFVLNIVMGAFTEYVLKVPDGTDSNTEALWNLSKGYMIFKTLIFGVVAEEILFRESISDVVDNNILYIIISSLIYTAMHFVFMDNSEYIFIDLLVYFIPALFFSTAYVRGNRNIVLLMLIKFAYNLIPVLLFI